MFVLLATNRCHDVISLYLTVLKLVSISICIDIFIRSVYYFDFIRDLLSSLISRMSLLYIENLQVMFSPRYFHKYFSQLITFKGKFSVKRIQFHFHR